MHHSSVRACVWKVLDMQGVTLRSARGTGCGTCCAGLWRAGRQAQSLACAAVAVAAEPSLDVAKVSLRLLPRSEQQSRLLESRGCEVPGIMRQGCHAT